jgi:hypothetical protein
LIASPRATTAGNGDTEKGWKRLSCERMGVDSGFEGAFLKRLNNDLVEKRGIV